MDTTISEKLAQLPSQPGVYLLLNSQGKIHYIGKAKSLKKRVASYFNRQGDGRPFAGILRRFTRDIQYIVTNNESEALLLEDTLIKKEKPKYNIDLRDDKQYVSLRLSISHRFPRLTVVRRPKPDGEAYFGPYVSAAATRETVKHLLKIFPLRSCNDRELTNRSRPCILYQIKLCSAPCVGKIDDQAYQQLVQQTRSFLKGQRSAVVKELEQSMRAASAAYDYDLAAHLRDKIKAIEQVSQQQHVVFHDQREEDVVGFAIAGELVVIKILTLREGKVLGSRDIRVKVAGELHDQLQTDQDQNEWLEESLASALLQHYRSHTFIPARLVLPVALPEAAALSKIFSDQVGHAVKIIHAQRGESSKLVQLANQNARAQLEALQKSQASQEELLRQTQEKLFLPKLPLRIEGYDISNIQGRDAVGSQVTFLRGVPEKKCYRTYKIKQVEGPNDFLSLKEVLGRRFARLIQSNDAHDWPDLMLIDGGKGQLNSVIEAMREVSQEVPEESGARARLLALPIASIAKIPLDGDEKGIMADRIFLPERKNPLNLASHHPVLHLLQRVRDESHRFAQSYHHRLKRKREFTSQLFAIPGVSKIRVRQLLQHFGSVDGVKQAGIEAIAELPGFSSGLAEKIYRFFHPT